MVTITVKKILMLPVVVAMFSIMLFSIQSVIAAGPLDLTGVGNFAVLANTYTNSNGGATLNGDLGYDVNASPTNPATITGAIFASHTPTYLLAQTIQTSLLASANNVGQTGSCTTSLSGAVDMSALSPLSPGIYCIDGAATVNTAGLTLSGSGTYIFRITGTINTVANSVVTLAGANANDVFWVPTGATTLGANSVFAGNVLTNASTTLLSTVSMNGRILSGGAVTITGPSDTITSPSYTASPLVAISSPLVAISSPLVTISPPVTTLTPSLPTIQNNAITPTLGIGSSGVSSTDQVYAYAGNAGTSIFSSSYVSLAPTVGAVNKAVFTIYEKGGPGEIRHLDLAFGLATGQIFSDSRIVIQWDKSLNGMETIKVIDPEHSMTNVRVETSRGSCDAGVVRNDCLVVVLYHTFTAPFEFNVIGTNVSDRISNISYWSGYDRNDLSEFGQLKKNQVLIATELWDSSKIQTHMPVILDNLKYFTVDNRDTLKFEQMKKDQNLIAVEFWDSSEIQNNKSDMIYKYLDNRDTLAFEQLKKDQVLIAMGFWDSSEIQNTAGVPKQSVSPASAYCFDNGGSIQISGSGTSAQIACVFSDGSECREWQYFRGQCIQGDSIT